MDDKQQRSIERLWLCVMIQGIAILLIALAQIVSTVERHYG